MESVSIKKPMFGNEVEFEVYNIYEPLAIEIIDEAYNEGMRLHDIFNIYDEGSEISRLNSARSMNVTDELLKVLKLALEKSKIDSGYDVSLGKFILKRKDGEVIPSTCSYKDISIDGNKVDLLHDDVAIDLGSVAKGYITDRMADVFIDKGVENFLIDSRGDIVVKGDVPHRIGIKDPRSDNEISIIGLQDASVATSGDYMQYKDDFSVSHIINQKDVSSVTVVAKSLIEADFFATLLFVSSEDNIDKILFDNKEIKAYIVDRYNNIKMFNGFESLIVENEK